MRVLVHDYSGHPFQVQLSRALARRGHEVLHVHCSSYETGKGALGATDLDPPTFAVEAIDLGRPVEKYAFGRRVRQELRYGSRFTQRAAAWGPDIIVSCNDPLFAKASAARWCRRNGIPWIFWLQDVYSLAMTTYAESRLGAVGRVLGRRFQATERRLLREAASVVAITDDFRPVLREWGLPDELCEVIENWAPLDALEVRDKVNPWSTALGLHDRRVLLYSGTLGLKHDPKVLAELAVRFRADDVSVVVVSEGPGAAWLATEKQNQAIENLLILPYQAFEELPNVLGTADVLLALLDRDAGVFSVPSKILTYLCAGRTILAAMPKENLGSRTIERAGAGVVVDPSDNAGMLEAAAKLLASEQTRREHGIRARDYAEQTFDIETIADRFEPILRRGIGAREPRRVTPR